MSCGRSKRQNFESEDCVRSAISVPEYSAEIVNMSMQNGTQIELPSVVTRIENVYSLCYFGHSEIAHTKCCKVSAATLRLALLILGALPAAVRTCPQTPQSYQVSPAGQVVALMLRTVCSAANSGIEIFNVRALVPRCLERTIGRLQFSRKP